MSCHPLSLVIAAALLAGGLTAQTVTIVPKPGANPGPPVTFQYGSPAASFRANCATCHGDIGAGGMQSWIDPAYTAPAIAGMDPNFIRGHVRGGRLPAMPAFPEQAISDVELDRLARYIQQLPAAHQAPPPFIHTVQVLDEDPWFSPMQLTVQPWDTVRFVNTGATYHPLVSEDWMASGGATGVNTGMLAPGGEVYMKFNSQGVVRLSLCGIHPYMKCEIHVGQPFTPPTYSVSTPSPLPTVPGVGEIWVCAQFQDWTGKGKDGVVQVIDAATWTVTHAIPVGNNPHNIWFGAGSQTAAVTSWFGTQVSQIDAATKTVISDCVAGPAPAHVTSDWAGMYWYVTIEASNYVRRFTQAPGPWSLCGSGGYPQTSTVGGFGPHGIWYSSGKLVVANSMDSTFSIVDTATMLETAVLPSGAYPLGASAARNGMLAAAGNGYGASVSVYDLVRERHIRDIPIGMSAIQVPFTPDSRYIVAAGGDSATIIDAVKAADPVNYPNPLDAIVAQIVTGKGAHGVAFGRNAAGGWYAYVTNKFEQYVSVIDLATLTKAGDVPLMTTTTGKVSLGGATDVGGQGIAIWPNPAPWQ